MRSSKALLLIAAPFLLLLGFIIGKKSEITSPPVADKISAAPLRTSTPVPEAFIFHQAIHSATGHKVIPFSPSDTAHQQTLEVITAAATATTYHFNSSPSPLQGLARINEASRYFEDFLLEAINKNSDFLCQFAAPASGKSQRSGYPDLRITHRPSGLTFYLDPKLYQQDLITSTQRTFYYSPASMNQKVTADAVHLLIGFAHDGNDGDWTFTHWSITDLYSIPLNHKTEFNASNKVLYQSAIAEAGKIDQ